MKILHSLKETRGKTPRVTYFHLYKMSRIGKSIKTESRLPRSWGKEVRHEE